MEDISAVEGEVKWFDSRRGFGFIVAVTGGPDILLHANVLRAFGHSTIGEGSTVLVRTQETPRGVQAIEVVSVTPPERPSAQPGAASIELEGIEHLPVEPARVKWFDKAKGFGFLNVFGRRDDIFVHMDVLRRSGLSDLEAGEAVAVRLTEGERGFMAVAVLGWDAAVEK